MFAQAAGNAVKRASDNLVKAAQKAAFDKAEDDSVVVKTKFVGGIAQVRLLFESFTFTARLSTKSAHFYLSALLCGNKFKVTFRTSMWIRLN